MKEGILLEVMKHRHTTDRKSKRPSASRVKGYPKAKNFRLFTRPGVFTLKFDQFKETEWLIG